MNRLIQLKKASPVFLVTLVCFGLLPTMQAVSPAPDGGYPGGNTAEGQAALLSLTTGSFNTAVGLLSLRSNTQGSFNTAIGAGTLVANNISNLVGPASKNTATGAGALFSNTVGYENTANGAFAAFGNTEGFDNTVNGYFALFYNTSGDDNTAIGSGALQNNISGSANTALGPSAGYNVTTANNVICIHHSGANVSNSCFIGHIRGVQTQNADAIPVIIDSAGQLRTASSSRRYKKEIKPMDKTSEAVLALKPVTFHYKSDKTNKPQFGLIAEEVAEVNADLVVRDKDGKPYTVRYDQVNAMLLNEFLKEHRKLEQQDHKIQKQEATITQLKTTVTEQEARATKQEAAIAAQQKQIEALTAGLQKVSAQIEMSQPATRIVAKNQR